LEREGWRAWYAEIFGQAFVDALDSEETDDCHHSEALGWHWEARNCLLRGERPPGDFFVFFPTWSRGNMKTTLGRCMLIADAALSLTAGEGGYALIPSGTKKKGRSTAISLEHLLHTSKVAEYYPQLSLVKRNPYGRSKGWTADFIYTEAGYVFHFVGLDEGMAGANVVDVRPTFIMPDDIDSREDSPVISENRFHVFTSEVLPARQGNTLVYWAQNLISRYSVRYRIEKQQERVLTNRKPNVPVPAVRGLVTETRTEHNIVKDVAVAGKCTWRGWNLRRVQDEIDTYGLKAFLRECQHEVEQDREGLVLQHWNDPVHVISLSEFESVYGTRELPFAWNKIVFNDWARTKTKFHANVAGVLTASAQNAALPGAVFLFHPMSFPAASTPEDVAERLLKAITPTVDAGGQSVAWADIIRSTLSREGIERFVPDLTELIRQRRQILANVLPRYVAPVLRAQNFLDFRMSHERTDVCRVYNDVFGLPFRGVNPGKDGGVDGLNLLMRVDYSLPHPFRPNKMGFTKFFMVAPDDVEAEPWTANSRVAVYPPKSYSDALTPDDLSDSDLARYQFANWRYRDPFVTPRGEREGDLLKMSDDFGNGLMMCFYDRSLSATPLSKEEARLAQLPEHLKPAAVKGKIGTEEFPDLYWAQQHALNKIGEREQAKERDEQKAWASYGNRPAQHGRYRRQK
jgi:hypothetical protein